MKQRVALTTIVAVALVACALVAADAAESKPDGYWVATRFLRGLWLVRPLPVDNPILQYTHRMVAIEGQFDGGVVAAVTSEPPGVPSAVAAAWEWAGQQLTPFWALFESKKRKAALDRLRAQELDAGQATSSEADGSSYVKARRALRAAVKRFFSSEIETLRVVVEGGESIFAGTVTITGYINETQAELDQRAKLAAEDESQPLPATAAVKPVFSVAEKYNFGVSPTATHHLKVSSGNNCGSLVVPIAAGAEHARCSSWQIAVTDQDHFMLTVVFMAGSVDVPFTLVFRREDDLNVGGGGKSGNTIMYTVIMLAIVAAVKFLPRVFIEWQGMDADKVVKGHERLSRMSESQRKRLLAEQFERIRKHQEEEQATQARAEKIVEAARKAAAAAAAAPSETKKDK